MLSVFADEASLGIATDGSTVQKKGARSESVDDTTPSRASEQSATTASRTILGAREALVKVASKMEDLLTELEVYLGDFLCTKMSVAAVNELPGEVFGERTENASQLLWESYEPPKDEAG